MYHMTKRFFLMFLLATNSFLIKAQITFTALEFTPAYPTANSKLQFKYNAAYSPLKDAKNISIILYVFNGFSWEVVEPVITKQNRIYTGSTQLDSNSTALVFRIQSGEEKDNNAGGGYVIPVYDRQQQFASGYYISAAILQNVLGENLFGMRSDVQAGLRLIEEGLQKYPAQRSNFGWMFNYWNILITLKKQDTQPTVIDQIHSFIKEDKLKEDQMLGVAELYSRMNMKAASDSMKQAYKNKYLQNNRGKIDLVESFNKEKVLEKKDSILTEIIVTYPNKERYTGEYDNLKASMASAFANAGNYSKYYEWLSRLPQDAKASELNNVAWEMAEKDKDLAEAAKMATEATSYAKAQLKKGIGTKPPTMTTADWEKEKQYTYSMYGDTYAFLMYKLGDYTKGYPVAKEAAAIREGRDASYNERYMLLAEKVLPTAEVTLLAEGMVKAGTASSTTKEILQRAYKFTKGNNEGFETYLQTLEQDAIVKRREEISKSIINEPSPNFSLKDFEGNKVSLQTLKGKVVVVDFWATWCGPCIASMPGMNKALTKYKDDKNVVFLFIDTWESGETEAEKLKIAKEFITQKGYPFQVLMDLTGNVAADFKVRGIPTKFIIGKDGNIRFKSVGFGGNDDVLLQELSTMIELASK